MHRSLALLALSAARAASGPVRADTGFRCGTGRLVSLGDRTGEMLDRCGEPDAVTQREPLPARFYRCIRGAGTAG